LLLACGADGDSSCSGDKVTLQADQGVSFGDGCVQTPGNFKNSDLYATDSGTYLKLSTGGPNSAHTMPVQWNTGKTFSSLEEVPVPAAELSGDGIPLPSVKSNMGFVLKNYTTGDYTKVWVQTAEPNSGSITLQFEQILID